MELIDTIATVADDGHIVLVAPLDLAGAFDTLDRDVITQKLSKTCGITDEAVQLIEN